MAETKHAQCGQCGMVCDPREYHPYAACLMFMGCHDGEKVRGNLAALAGLSPVSAPQPNAALADGWMPIETAPKDNTPIRLYAQGGGFHDEDFNPSGSVEGFWSDGEWCGAFWDGVHDTWFRRNGIVPTHWQPLPAPPTLNASKGESGHG